MRALFCILFFTGVVTTGYSQKKKLLIPLLTGITSLDSAQNEKNDLPITIERDFDLFIRYRDISGGGIQRMRKQKAFAWRADSGWYSITDKYDLSSADFRKEGIKQYIIKMDQTEGDSLYNILTANHFFGMTSEDAKGKGACNVYSTHRNLYQFEIFTKKEYKSFLMQGSFSFEPDCDKDQGRQQMLNCFNSFEKYLGN